MEKKMTYAVAIDKAINGEMTDEVKVRLQELKAQLAKRSTAKATKAQEANAGIKGVILADLAERGKATITEMIKRNEELGEFSCSKISSLTTQLVKEGAVIRTMEGKKAIFSLPSEDEEVVEE